jgi:hypothetical protein
MHASCSVCWSNFPHLLANSFLHDRWPTSSIPIWNGSLLGSIEFDDKLGLVHLVWSKFFFLTFCAHCHPGKIYAGYNINSGEEIAIKLESRSAGYRHLDNEFKAYNVLGNRYMGIPHVKWFGVERDYTIMTLTLLGPSLEELFTFNHHKFTTSTVLIIADQLVCSHYNI